MDSPIKNLMILPQFGTVELNAYYCINPCSDNQFDNESSEFGSDYDERKIKLVVTTHQMCVLDLFNDHNTLTFAVIYLSFFFYKFF